MSLYFPIFVNLSQKKIVIVGAGNIASRRIATLVQFSSNITVIAPKVNLEIEELAKTYNFKIFVRQYRREDILESDLVIAATDNLAVNDDIYYTCKQFGILVNVCSDQNKCDFYFPAIVKKSNVIVGITSGGENHVLVKKVAQQIRDCLDNSSWEG